VSDLIFFDQVELTPHVTVAIAVALKSDAINTGSHVFYSSGE